MTWTLTQPLLDFALWSAIGAVIAGACYGFSRAVNIDTPGCAGILGVVGAVFTGVLVSYPVLVAVLFCVPAALAQQRLSCGRTLALVHYFDLLSVTCLCIVIGYAVTSLWGDSTTSLEAWGFFLGLTSTPSAIPLLRWVWRSSKTRPGLDRHLNSLDELF